MESIHENALLCSIGGDFEIFEVTLFFEARKGWRVFKRKHL
jgi:hypothetical protein